MLYQIFLGISLVASLGAGVDDVLGRIKISDQEKQLEDQNKKMQQMAKRISELITENEALHELNDNLKDENTKLKAAIHTLNDHIIELNNQIETQKIQIESLSRTIKALNETIANLNKEIVGLKVTIKQQDSQIMYLTATNTLYSKVIDLQRDTINEKREEIKNLTTKVEKLTEENTNLNAELKKKNFQIAGLSAANVLLKKTVELEEKVIEEKDGKIAAYLMTIKQLGIVLDYVSVEKVLLNKTVEVERTEKTKFIQGQMTTIVKQAYHIAGLDATLAIMEQVVKVQEVYLNEDKKMMKEQNKTIKELNTLIGSMNETIHTLIDEKAQLEEQVANLTKNVTDLNATVAALGEIIKNNNLKNAECQISWLKYKILEEMSGKHINLKKVYSSPGDECDARKFRSKCGNISPSAFIATEKTTGLQFGGFTNEKFDGKSDWKTDNHAFTYSLTTLAKCNITNPARAIYSGETYRLIDRPTLDFGEWDIWVTEKCLSGNTLVQPEKTYHCPSNDVPHFYSSVANPKLAGFDFYQVEGL